MAHLKTQAKNRETDIVPSGWTAPSILSEGTLLLVSFPAGPNATVTTVEFMHHQRCISPFKKISAKYKEEDMNPNKYIMVVCVFLSSRPAWGRRVCVASLQQYYIRCRAGWCVVRPHAIQHNHFPTEHHTEESPGGEEEKQDISTTQHLQHSTCSTRSQSEMCPPGPSQHKNQKSLSKKSNCLRNSKPRCLCTPKKPMGQPMQWTGCLVMPCKNRFAKQWPREGTTLEFISI